jgi:pimeloyl-ACP methyl ester carboxylesterase
VGINAVISNFARNAIRRKGALAFGSRLMAAGLIVCVGMTGCALSRQEVRLPVTEVNQQGVVFVVDGAGSFHATTKALQEAVAEACLPLQVVCVDWSHGFGRMVADHTDWCHSQEEGHRLAGQIASYRQSCPGSAIYLFAHSAGSAVALVAASDVPPDTIDRLILLAPSVSSNFDLRPALRGTREGIDVFYSDRDVFSLGFCVALVGTADGRRDCPAAGRVGFQTPMETPGDAVLYAKLRQHAWEPCLLWTGNHGRHSGAKHQRFLQAYVLPLMDRRQSCPMPESPVYSASAETSGRGP